MTRLCVGLADKSSGHYDWRVRYHGAGGYRSIMNGHSSKPEWAAFTRVEVLIIALTIGVLAGCLTVTGKNLIWGENTGLLRYFPESSAA
jgi:hypothetical protein